MKKRRGIMPKLIGNGTDSFFGRNSDYKKSAFVEDQRREAVSLAI